MFIVVLGLSQPTISTEEFHKNQDCVRVANTEAQALITKLQNAANEKLRTYQTACESEKMLDAYYRDPDAQRRTCANFLDVANQARWTEMHARSQAVGIFGCAE